MDEKQIYEVLEMAHTMGVIEINNDGLLERALTDIQFMRKFEPFSGGYIKLKALALMIALSMEVDDEDDAALDDTPLGESLGVTLDAAANNARVALEQLPSAKDDLPEHWRGPAGGEDEASVSHEC